MARPFFGKEPAGGHLSRGFVLDFGDLARKFVVLGSKFWVLEDLRSLEQRIIIIVVLAFVVLCVDRSTGTNTNRRQHER